MVRYWGRIDDQYGFKTGAGYVKPKLNERSLADAITQVLAGEDVSNPVAKADGCFIGRVAKAAPKGDVTYSKHIARIMEARCVECHRSGEVAAFTLGSYADVVGWAETIREVVQEGRMPPWFADPKYGHFTNDARLSDDEKKAGRADRVDNGCPEGDAKDLPTPRTFAAGWQMGEPDQVIYMRDKPYTVPAEGTIKYQFFTADPGWTEDKWIQATEARPGNRAVVHHIIVMVAAKDGNDGVVGVDSAGYGRARRRTSTAGHGPVCAGRFEAGLPDALHQQLGVQQDDRSMVGVRFADPEKGQASRARRAGGRHHVPDSSRRSEFRS